MRFCPSCENLLLPKNEKLFCRVCNKEFKLDGSINDYVVIKRIRHEENKLEPIIVYQNINKSRITIKERKAYEEFFQIG